MKKIPPSTARIAVWREVLEAVLLDCIPKKQNAKAIIQTLLGGLDDEESWTLLRDMIHFQPAPPAK